MMIRPSGITISFGGASGKPGDSRPVVARIFGFAEGEEAPVSHEMVVPAGARVEQELSKGLYNVELTLPSGRLLQRNVRISEDTHEDFQFLDDFGSTAEFSLQEAVGHIEGDVLSRATAVDADGENSQDGTEPQQARVQQSMTGAQKGLRSHIRKERRVRPVRNIARNRVDPKASLALNRGWLPNASWDLPEPGGWTFAEPKDVSGGRLLWRVADIEYGHLSADNRHWARIERPDRGIEIASLPLPWYRSDDPGFATADILFDPARSTGAATTVAINDVALSGLLSFLDRGQAAAAGPMLESDGMPGLIENTIYGKMGNPLAACAAGYVGLAAFPHERRERYDPWLRNCMERFPSIPDAAIINARRLILRPRTAEDNDRAAQALRQAFNAGIPYFSTGVVLLREMLLQLSSDHSDLALLAEKVGLLVGRVDVTQVFTVLRYAPPAKG